MPKCRDCLHVDVCEHYAKTLNQKLAQYCNIQIPFEKEKPHSEPCEFFKGRSRFVELPCHTGEKVWVTYLGREETRSVEKGEVIGFYITASLCVYTSVILEDGSTFTGAYGKNVFPRKEKLEDRDNNAGQNDT